MTTINVTQECIDKADRLREEGVTLNNDPIFWAIYNEFELNGVKKFKNKLPEEALQVIKDFELRKEIKPMTFTLEDIE